MKTLWQQFNDELADVLAETRLSLVQVRNGREGYGAGTVWHSDGLILTNAHVVRNDRPKVVLPDGRVFPSRVLAYNRNLDLAALSIEAHGLKSIPLGASRTLRPGEWVTALGHPWGVEGASTAGVVIGVGSWWPEMPRSGQDWLVVSLHLRPGHSGGPLVDSHGRLIGINTMMTGPDVGVAVPVHIAKTFLNQALEAKKEVVAV